MVVIKNISLFALLFIANNIQAQLNKIDTDRPDQTESAYTIPKKWMQFEMGFNMQRNSPGNDEYFIPTLLSKYGLGKKIELRLITTISSNSSLQIPQGTVTETGLLPVEIGSKIMFWEEKKWIPKTSLLFHIAIPQLASKKYQADKLAPNFRFSMQNSLTKSIALGYNLGAEWDGYSDQPRWVYTFAPGFDLGEKWYAYIEAFGSFAKNELPENSLDGGIAYFISNNIKVDISSGFGISAVAPDWYAAIGGSIRFNTGK